MKIIARRCGSGSRWQAKLKGLDTTCYDDTYIGAIGSLVIAHAKELGIEITKARPTKDLCEILAHLKK